MKTWITKDGRKILICEMDDSHLHNTFCFLARRLYNEEYVSHTCNVENDGPCYNCELDKTRKHKWQSLLADMEEELNFRKLNNNYV